MQCHASPVSMQRKGSLPSGAGCRSPGLPCPVARAVAGRLRAAERRVAGEGGRGLPDGDGEREIPRGDQSGDAVRGAAGEQQPGSGGRLMDGADRVVRLLRLHRGARRDRAVAGAPAPRMTRAASALPARSTRPGRGVQGDGPDGSRRSAPTGGRRHGRGRRWRVRRGARPCGYRGGSRRGGRGYGRRRGSWCPSGARGDEPGAGGGRGAGLLGFRG